MDHPWTITVVAGTNCISLGVPLFHFQAPKSRPPTKKGTALWPYTDRRERVPYYHLNYSCAQVDKATRKTEKILHHPDRFPLSLVDLYFTGFFISKFHFFPIPPSLRYDNASAAHDRRWSRNAVRRFDDPRLRTKSLSVSDHDLIRGLFFLSISLFLVGD